MGRNKPSIGSVILEIVRVIKKVHLTDTLGLDSQYVKNMRPKKKSYVALKSENWKIGSVGQIFFFFFNF